MQDDHLLTLNNMNRPVVLEDKDATYYKLIRLIWMEKGTYPDHPDMGVGIVSNFRFTTDTELENLKSSVEEQIRTYIPEALDSQVDVSYTDDGNIQIDITIEDLMYVFEVDESSKKLLNNL